MGQCNKRTTVNKLCERNDEIPQSPVLPHQDSFVLLRLRPSIAYSMMKWEKNQYCKGKKWKFGVKLMQFFVLMQYDLYSCAIFAIQNVLILIEVNCLCFLIYEHSQVNIYIFTWKCCKTLVDFYSRLMTFQSLSHLSRPNSQQTFDLSFHLNM